MTIQEMQERKRELGYTYAQIAELSGLASWNRAEGAGRDYADAKV